VFATVELSTAICAEVLDPVTRKAKERIQIFPAGPHLNALDKRQWKLTNPQRIVLARQANPLELPTDIEHATQLRAPLGLSAEAQAWLQQLSVCAEGKTWADVKWTDHGRELVESGKYKYLSPAFTVDPLTNEIATLESAGLTNKPALVMAALASVGAGAMTMDKELLALLGLPETATMADVLAAIKKLQSTATATASQVDLTKYVPMHLFNQVLARAEKAEANAPDPEAERVKAVDDAIAGGFVVPADRQQKLEMCSLQGGLELFRRSLPKVPITQPTIASQRRPGVQTASAKTPDDTDRKIAKSLGLSIEEYMAVNPA